MAKTTAAKKQDFDSTRDGSASHEAKAGRHGGLHHRGALQAGGREDYMKDKGKKEGKKIMKLPRFSYQLPEDLTPAFLKEMEEDFRESPGELVTAIIRRHFQKKSEEKILRHFATESSDPGAIPYVGPQPNVESDAPKQAHSEDE